MPTWGWILTVVLGVPSLILFLVWLFGGQKPSASNREETLYFSSQKAVISYTWRIRHARFPKVCRLIYWFKPFEIRLTSRYASKLHVDTLEGRNEFGEELGGIKDVNIQYSGDNVKIVWPKKQLIGNEIEMVEARASGHITQQEISDRIEIIRQPIKGGTKKRWRYHIFNKSDAIVRDFEFDMTDIAKNPEDITLIEARPDYTTSKTDILVRAECQLDGYKKDEEVKIVWQLPKIERKGELILIIEC